MIVETKVRRVGGSLVCVLPKEAVKGLNVEEGDRLFFNQTPDGSFRVTAGDPEFAKQMEIARKGMRKYRNTLRELAK